MRNILLFSGTALLALAMQGCATPNTVSGGHENYQKLAADLKEYEPVGDVKIDGLARPFVTSAIQLRADVDKESTKLLASEASKELGRTSPENFEQAFNALEPEKRKSLIAEAEAAERADGARLESLLKQLADLGVAGGKLVIDIQSASKGNAGGAAETAANLFGGPGKNAIGQVNAAMDFGVAANDLISSYRKLNAQIRAANESNVKKAQS
jgi:hypothetical protein